MFHMKILNFIYVGYINYSILFSHRESKREGGGRERESCS
jgi:hypothetical protein